MRIKNSIKNISMAVFTQLTLGILGFLSRKIFVMSLGEEFLGLNGVMTNVISVMSLVESGIGVSIVYSMYKPLAEKDEKSVIALIQLYKKIYRVISIAIFSVSMMIYPLLPVILKKSSVDMTTARIVFMIFVVQNIVTYLYAHKISMINAD